MDNWKVEKLVSNFLYNYTLFGMTLLWKTPLKKYTWAGENQVCLVGALTLLDIPQKNALPKIYLWVTEWFYKYTCTV